MAHISSQPVCLYGSLFALAAVCVVTSVALTGWTRGISDRLLGTSDYNTPIEHDRIVGGLVKLQADAYTGPAPPPVYRPPQERLPSQMPQPLDDYLDVYGNTVEPVMAMADDPDNQTSRTIETDTFIETEGVAEDVINSPDNSIAQQAAILAEMRSRSKPDAELSLN